MGKEKVVCSVRAKASEMVHCSDVMMGYLLDRERIVRLVQRKGSHWESL